MHFVDHANDHLVSDSYHRMPYNYQTSAASPYPTPYPHYQNNKSTGSNPPSYDGLQFSQRPHGPQTLPEVGQTRCYWTLLNASLQFLVLDPVLEYHLHDQAPAFLGTNLLDYVHPDEKESAQNDLGRVLRDRELHGSVTRVRYCRLSKVRRILGHEPSKTSPPYPPSFPADLIAIDSSFMAVDIVINYAADGLVLCFIHAVVDILPEEDNDENCKTGWSNWCSTYGFDDERAEMTMHRLYEVSNLIQGSIVPSPEPSLRVLQILRNVPERSVLLSWPPEPYPNFQGRSSLPTAEHLSSISQSVQLTDGSNFSSEAKTSCTRRFKSSQVLTYQCVDGQRYSTVDSIFVLHGSVIFACYKIDLPDYAVHNGLNEPFPQDQPHLQDLFYSYNEAHSAPQQEYAPRVNAGDERNAIYPANSQHTVQNQNYQDWPVDQQSYSMIQPGIHDHQNSSQRVHVLSDVVHDQQPWMEDSAYQHTISQDPESRSPHFYSSDSVKVDQRTGTPALRNSPPSDGESSSLNNDSPQQVRRYLVKDSARENYTALLGGKSSGSGGPPVGVTCCASCKTTRSPEWRKGPNGIKELCNACGLRFARSRAKKEGAITKKKKDKLNPPIRSPILKAMVMKSEYQNDLPSMIPTQSHVRSTIREQTHEGNDSISQYASSSSSSPAASIRSQHPRPSSVSYLDSPRQYAIPMRTGMNQDDRDDGAVYRSSYTLTHPSPNIHAPVPSSLMQHPLAYLSEEEGRHLTSSPALSETD